MLESLILSVYVGQEVFRAFRQVQYGFQVDDFRAGGSNGRKTPGEQLQVAQVVFYRDSVDALLSRHINRNV